MNHSDATGVEDGGQKKEQFAGSDQVSWFGDKEWDGSDMSRRRTVKDDEEDLRLVMEEDGRR